MLILENGIFTVKKENVYNRKAKRFEEKRWNNDNKTIDLGTIEDFNLNHFMDWAVEIINNQTESNFINEFVNGMKIKPLGTLSEK